MLVHHDLDSAKWVEHKGTIQNVCIATEIKIIHAAYHKPIFRKYFTQAMISSPQDKRIISNFNTLLQDEDFVGDPTSNAHEEFLQSTDKME